MKQTILILTLGLSACSPPSQRRAAPATPSITPSITSRLQLTEAEIRDLPSDLRHEIGADLHHYFRYISRRFVAVQCDLGAEGPVVNLHGDAHLEQYLVTTLGRGLGDFDEATVGPVSIDLLRLATSIRIASRARGWRAEALWSAFLEGYVLSLEDPSTVAPEPSYVAREESRFRHDHLRLLAECETLIQPVAETMSVSIEEGLQAYIASLQVRRPRVEADWFDVVNVGRHEVGVASRAMTNFLIRVRGPTDAPEDDIVLEAKAVTSNPEAHCLPLSGRQDALRVLLGEARLAYTPFHLVGAVEIDGQPYWIHEWVDDYTELRTESQDLTSPMMLEILFDIGVQLGAGHPRKMSADSSSLRQALRAFALRSGGAIWETSEELAGEVRGAWRELHAHPNPG
ncbi:MAG: hypothetical protein ACI9KE_003854 [Polyangiales bacterium]|jgi:uncharacterized protein (DUF2252 family)